MKKFELGRVVATMGAIGTIGLEGVAAMVSLHSSGDWGGVEEGDRRANEEALESGERILSSYTNRLPQKIFVVTEWDRSTTTVMLENEY